MDDWVRDVVDERALGTLVWPRSVPSCDIVPSAWLFVAFKAARIMLNLAENRAIKASDYMDVEHVACGYYFDVLVTDDRALRETCALLGTELPFKIEGFRDVLVRLATDV